MYSKCIPKVIGTPTKHRSDKVQYSFTNSYIHSHEHIKPSSDSEHCSDLTHARSNEEQKRAVITAD
uniref:Uncharacterized protein n=1 Tax=Anguilla anguilla TaxID=7936 RepID=A0A0E9QRY3_ANGAN